MFDGLKDKLTSFTEETEEDVAEDAVEELDEAADADVEGDGVDESEEEIREESGSSPAGHEGSAASEELQHGSPDEDHEDGVAQPSEDGAAIVEDEATDSEDDVEEGEGEDVEEGEGEDVEEREGEDEKIEGEDNGRSLTQRAKLFASGKTVIDEDDLESHLHDLEFALLGSDVELEVTEEILDGVEENLVGETRRRLSSTGNLVRDALREALYDVISVGQFDFDERVGEGEKPFVIIFTGVNGVGKTTTIAKMAHYFEERGLSAVLANGDTFRAGANEQLEEHADNLDKKIISHEQGSDPAAVIYDAVEYARANDVDVVLGDTAGRLHTSDGLMDQLSKIDRVIDPDMTLFVDESVAGQDAVHRASEFDAAASIDGTVLTKADADTQGGAAISISHVTGKPILFLGTGQDYDDLEQFEPERIVDALVGEE